MIADRAARTTAEPASASASCRRIVAPARRARRSRRRPARRPSPCDGSLASTASPSSRIVQEHVDPAAVVEHGRAGGRCRRARRSRARSRRFATCTTRPGAAATACADLGHAQHGEHARVERARARARSGRRARSRRARRRTRAASAGTSSTRADRVRAPASATATWPVDALRPPTSAFSDDRRRSSRARPARPRRGAGRPRRARR